MGLISINRCSTGAYVRYYMNGWHYFLFNNRFEIEKTSEVKGTQVKERFSDISRIEQATGKEVKTYYNLGVQGVSGSEFDGIKGIIYAELVQMYLAERWADMEVQRESFTVRPNQQNAYDITLRARMLNIGDIERAQIIPDEDVTPILPAETLYFETFDGTPDWGFAATEIPSTSQVLKTNIGGYSDWYLPSIDELEQMYINLKLESIGIFSDSIYWSSTQYDIANSYFCAFDDGNIDNEAKNEPFKVRPVRDFTSTDVYALGDFGQAGYIFYITDLGGGSYKYYEAAPLEVATTYAWGLTSNNITGTSDTVGTGAANTALIVAVETGKAANYCDEFSSGAEENALECFLKADDTLSYINMRIELSNYLTNYGTIKATAEMAFYGFATGFGLVDVGDSLELRITTGVIADLEAYNYDTKKIDKELTQIVTPTKPIRWVRIYFTNFTKAYTGTSIDVSAFVNWIKIERL